MAIVRYKASDIPPPTQAELERVHAIEDENIDVSDIPPLDEDFFTYAERFHELYRPQKKQVTIRIDADILAWLKQDGKGYQTRLNEILRQAMRKQLLG